MAFSTIRRLDLWKCIVLPPFVSLFFFLLLYMSADVDVDADVDVFCDFPFPFVPLQIG